MSDLYLNTILGQLPDAALIVNYEGLIVQCNQYAQELFGYTEKELINQHINMLVPPEKREHHTVFLAQYMAEPTRRRLASGIKFVGYRKDGGSFPADISLGLIGISDKPLVMAVVRDITRHLKAEEELRQSNRALRMLSSSNRAMMHITQEDDLLHEVCKVAVEVGGYRLAWVGMAQLDEEKSVLPVAWYGVNEEFLGYVRGMSWEDTEYSKSVVGEAIRTGEAQVRHNILNNNNMRHRHEYALKFDFQSALVLPLKFSDEVLGAIVFYAKAPYAFSAAEVVMLKELTNDLIFGIQSIRIRKAHEYARDHVRQLAYYDRLTGLPNRSLFIEQLEREIAAAAAQKSKLYLLLLGVRHLREINENYGHTVGDQVLMRTGSQLLEVCGQGQFLARFNNNDFAMICADIDQNEAIAICDEVLSAVSSPFMLSGTRLSVGGNIGIAVYPDDGDSTAELLSKSDLAMSRAKSIGSVWSFYRPEMRLHLARTLDLTYRLELALQKNSLMLYYQPKIELATGRLVGAEALLRWYDAELGWVSPAEFIPVAETRGMMIELGNWVLGEACRQICRWQQEQLFHYGRIAVNVSAHQLNDSNFLGTFNHIVAESGITCNCIELELTESAIMGDPEQVIGILQKLKDQGFSIAIDDFGTGYSSLAYLKRFPVDTLKIDQTFVRDMLEDQNDRVIVSTIVAIALQLGLTPVAEGVEHEEHRQLLIQQGCLQAQGYLFGRPESADSFAVNWMRK